MPKFNQNLHEINIYKKNNDVDFIEACILELSLFKDFLVVENATESLGCLNQLDNFEIEKLMGMVKHLDTTKHYPSLSPYHLFMSSNKNKKHQFRPAMDEASSSVHDEHIKKIREQEKT